MADDPKPTILVPATAGAAVASTELARPMIARDLDRAGRGQLVYVGRDGEVKNPIAVRNRQVAAYVTFGGITAAGVALAASSFPDAPVPFYVLLGSRFLGTVRAVKRVNEASVALSKGDAATGRALAEPITRAWWVPGRVRALAELRVAIADALDGNGDKALERVRRARVKLSPRLIQHQFSYYTEINLLTALGRAKEARAILEARGGVPTGEVLKLSYWIAQMHLWVAEPPPRIDLDDSRLHDRMRKGLSMTAGADLLLLCAWLYAHRGEHELATFAYWRQSKEREGSQRLDVAFAEARGVDGAVPRHASRGRPARAGHRRIANKSIDDRGRAAPRARRATEAFLDGPRDDAPGNGSAARAIGPTSLRRLRSNTRESPRRGSSPKSSPDRSRGLHLLVPCGCAPGSGQPPSAPRQSPPGVSSRCCLASCWPRRSPCSSP